MFKNFFEHCVCEHWSFFINFHITWSLLYWQKGKGPNVPPPLQYFRGPCMSDKKTYQCQINNSKQNIYIFFFSRKNLSKKFQRIMIPCERLPRVKLTLNLRNYSCFLGCTLAGEAFFVLAQYVLIFNGIFLISSISKYIPVKSRAVDLSTLQF